jgi:hypothetical protein
MTQDPLIEQLVIERMGQMYHDYAQALKDLNDIRSGQTVVIPANMEHAKFMVVMGQHYINQTHKITFDALTKEYQNG